MVKEITVEELKEKKENGDNFFLLDVREEFEYMVSNIDGHHIPLGQLQTRVKEIEDHKNEEVVIMCRSGGRSSKAVQFLQSQGFEEVYNLKGGMKAWAKEIEPGTPVA